MFVEMYTSNMRSSSAGKIHRAYPVMYTNNCPHHIADITFQIFPQQYHQLRRVKCVMVYTS